MTPLRISLLPYKIFTLMVLLANLFEPLHKTSNRKACRWTTATLRLVRLRGCSRAQSPAVIDVVQGTAPGERGTVFRRKPTRLVEEVRGLSFTKACCGDLSLFREDYSFAIASREYSRRLLRRIANLINNFYFPIGPREIGIGLPPILMCAVSGDVPPCAFILKPHRITGRIPLKHTG